MDLLHTDISGRDILSLLVTLLFWVIVLSEIRRKKSATRPRQDSTDFWSPQMQRSLVVFVGLLPLLLFFAYFLGFGSYLGYLIIALQVGALACGIWWIISKFNLKRLPDPGTDAGRTD